MVSSHSNDRKDDYVHGIYDVSLDVTLSNDTNTTAIDMLEDENIIDPDDDMHSRNIECTVLDTVFRLPMRHRRVLLERRITEKPKSYEAIGKERARPVSREFVRLEELAALKVFKDVYRHHYPDYAAEYEGKKEVA